MHYLKEGMLMEMKVSFRIIMIWNKSNFKKYRIHQLFKAFIHLYLTKHSMLQSLLTYKNEQRVVISICYVTFFCSNFLLSLLWEFCRGNLVESWLFLGNGVIKEMFRIYSQQLWISIMVQTRDQNAIEKNAKIL